MGPGARRRPAAVQSGWRGRSGAPKMSLIGAIVVIGFSLVAFLHFVGRIFRNRQPGKPPAASAVSGALALLSLGPIVVEGLTHGIIRPSFYGLVELAAVALSFGLVVAIIRVEQMDEQREEVRRARQEAARIAAKLPRR